MRAFGFSLSVAAAVMALAAGADSARAGWYALPDLAVPNAPGESVGAPKVAVARDGTALVAFQHYDGENYRAGVVARVPGGGFGVVRDLSAAGRDAFGTVIAFDRQGNATIVWDEYAAGGSTVQERFRPSGGDWGAVATLFTGTLYSLPVLAVGDNGATVVAWVQQLSGPSLQTQAVASVRASKDQAFSSV